MRVRCLVVVTLAVLCSFALLSRTAAAAHVGQGEKIDFLARLSELSPAYAKFNAFRQDLLFPLSAPKLDKIGYKYSRVPILAPFWTRNGVFVVYNGKRYMSVGTDAEAVARTLGVPEDVLVVPFFYRWPLEVAVFGLVILMCAGAAGLGLALRCRKFLRLLAKPEYRRALVIIFDSDGDRLDDAVEHVRQHGALEHEAKANIRLLLSLHRSIKI